MPVKGSSHDSGSAWVPSTERRLRETMCVGVVHVTLVLSTPPPDPRGNLGSKRGVITHPQTSQNPKFFRKVIATVSQTTVPKWIRSCRSRACAVAGDEVRTSCIPLYPSPPLHGKLGKINRGITFRLQANPSFKGDVLQESSHGLLVFFCQ